MAATTLVKHFIRGVCTTLQDISPQYSRWTEVEIVRAINFGQMAQSAYLPMVGSRVDAIKLTPGTRQDITKVLAANIKPGDGSAPADALGISLLEIVRNMGTDGFTPGRVIRPVDRYTLDTNDPDWHASSASAADITANKAVREFVYSKDTPKSFYVVPGVHASTAQWVEIRWNVEPKRVPDGGEPNAELYRYDGASTAVLGINDQFVEALHNYVVAVLLLKGSKNTQNIPKAQLHAGLFTSSVNAMAAMITGTSPELKTLPFIDQIPAAA